MIQPQDGFKEKTETIVGKVFGTPLLVKGRSWLPLAQLVTWPLMAWLGQTQAAGTLLVAVSGDWVATMPVALGSE